MTARQTPAATRSVRRRPKDRKAQIAREAAEAFSALGYHAVSVEAIAARVGVSAPAVYRHYTSKYDLFRGAVLALSQQLVDATATVDAADEDPHTRLEQMARATVDVALRNRASGGLYRWQTRYLQDPDAAQLTAQLRLVNHRIQRPIAALRPTLTSAQQWMLSSGLLSVAGSIVDHHLRAPDDTIRAILTGGINALVSAPLPDPGAVWERRAGWRIFAADAGTYEALLHAAMRLFAHRGYAETSMAQIAEAVELPVSGIYRYFSGKSEILATAMRRAADRLSAELARVQGPRTAPRETLTRLVDAYVTTSFANPELASVYYSERVSLTPNDQMLLRSVQRSTVGSWVELLIAARPELDATAARFLIHAAMVLVVDLGRLVHYDRMAEGDGDCGDPLSYPQACVQTLMEAVLFDTDVADAAPSGAGTGSASTG
ncbi:TetR/AcrR family transcriptional regulator [Mycobacterium koreense]|uniref:TetR family transcriptional regulator n=1 Tax=Mycolicibacillus koreensis TaxID=1069220 RepID=A0A7I7SCP7_9MYCO|nr:TetR/AcrR family transcriptional regulator [Mycolicibacillus koreensis]MCV7249950.1 TetR/AcrR family transcriptional regulator [Mycolicibacillus koreensis]OSC34834.1 TetR family transcriptional regulator [Mycolicibacillus koreensis]BBY54694.1 TetR family transcriptional regulator [Mycolicibacillus koreensis]